jgi:Xaa-Pro aminopeptidase
LVVTNTTRTYLTGLMFLCWLGVPALLAAQTPEEYQKRREAVRAKMEPTSVLILRGAALAGEERPRRDNNLYYLTGIDEPGVSLIIYPEQPPIALPPGVSASDLPPGVRLGPPKEVLFVPAPGGPGGAGMAMAAGRGPQQAAQPQKLERPGFERVLPASDFQAVFDSLLLTPFFAALAAGTSGGPSAGAGATARQGSIVYIDYQRSRSLRDPMTTDEQIFKLARDKGGDFTIKPASTLIGPLRRIKSAAEIETMKTAAVITAAAEREAMRAARPGLYEYQIQSIIEHVFSINGARRPGFETIVGSGPNSCILHWSENSRQTQPGDVVVMDIGAEYRGYTADITRTIPVSGTFTKRQREVYETVLKANQAAIEMVKPGISMREISAKVNDILTEGLIALGLIKDKSQLRRYYTHGLGHSVGLQVHDVGPITTLEPGMILTIEPGLYIPEESLGIRIEDDVLVTENGGLVLTEAAPKKVDEVEALMKQGGIDFSRYLVNTR